ncbi:hypothetical protein F4818DRAFT_456999 [Hypoxylon cercidicola]|nr:hypothetical protein F4818DRAFT_456999 [Hypoxylon cercidicola]
MCLGTLTHHMHHDVRTPMIVDPDVEHPTIYANPQHTSYHRCEIQLPESLEGLLIGDCVVCPDHSCCIAIGKIDMCDYFRKYFCNTAGEYTGDEPDGCKYLVLEHRHKRLDYLGVPHEFLPKVCCPSTWRAEINELHRDWAQWFGRDNAEFQHWRKQEDWDEGFYSACEKLYTRALDAEIHHLVYIDLFNLCSAEDPRVVTAEENWRLAKGMVADQQDEIFSLLDLSEDSRCKYPISHSPEDAGSEYTDSKGTDPESSFDSTNSECLREIAKKAMRQQ